MEEILKEKLRKVIQPLSKQIKDPMQSVNSKYDQIAKTLKDLDEAKDKQILENASLKAEILKSVSMRKPGRTRQEVIHLKSRISLKLGINVGFGE